MSAVAIEVAEVAKLLLQGYFTMARQKGLSEEEALKLYINSKEQFDKNTPDKLEGV